MDPHDEPAPTGEPQESSLDSDLVDPSWSFPGPEPTRLIALWIHPQPPSVTEVQAALSGPAGGPLTIDDEFDTDDERIRWSIVARVPALDLPLLIWCQESHPLEPGELGDPVAEQAPWVIGIETVLDPADPLASFTVALRLLLNGFSDIPAVLDVNALRWHRRESMEAFLGDDDIEPPAEILWMIHAVYRGQDPGPEDPVWIHTHGLSRCGRPELEMLQVPARAAGMAEYLMNSIGELVLEQGVPEIGAPLAVGTELHVVLHPWEEVAATVPADVPGSLMMRSDDTGEHSGVQAVICASDPKGRESPAWVWPENVILRLEGDEGILYMTARATERRARLARATWSQMAMAFAATPPELRPPSSEPAVVFVIKAGFAPDDDESVDREHLWFEVHRIDGDRAEGMLLNEPLGAVGLRHGDQRWIERDQCSDWLVMTRLGPCEPSRADQLWGLVERVREGAEATE
ncbi:MAG: DUF4026 domain-containing protein [Phycisphaerales bacterium]|nr:DUF4026 domain-containing protein [Phycisphaerales bacterium]